MTKHRIARLIAAAALASAIFLPVGEAAAAPTVAPQVTAATKLTPSPALGGRANASMMRTLSEGVWP